MSPLLPQLHSILLFLIFLESCPGKLIEIHGKPGLFLEGQIHPELEGVEIVISEKGASSPLITVFTDDKGACRYALGRACARSIMRQVGAWIFWGRPWKQSHSYHLSLSCSVGPLHSDQEYTVTSQKEGYVLTAVEGTVGDFKAYALAGVSFEVMYFTGHFLWGDGHSNKPHRAHSFYT